MSAKALPLRSSSSTRLTCSKKPFQSKADIRRMLVITLRTVTFMAACASWSSRTMSSVVVPCAARRSSSQRSAGTTVGSCSRRRCTSWTEKLRGSGSFPSRRSARFASSVSRPPMPSRPSAIWSARCRSVRLRDDPLREPPQVLDQHDAQRDRHRPQLADPEGLLALVRLHEATQRLGVEPAVGVRHEGPSDAEDARVALRDAPPRASAAHDRSRAASGRGCPGAARRRCGSCRRATRRPE